MPNPNAMATEDYYSDAPDSAPDKSADAPKTDEGEMPVATLPKAMLMGKDFKPGDEIVLKIDSIHDDEVVVSYAPEKPKEGEGEGAPEPGGPPPDSEMASMMD